MNPRKLVVLALIAVLVGAFFLFDLGSYLTFDALKSSRDQILAWREARPFTAVLVFFLVYGAVTALSLPGATIMT
ncbi:MAG: pyridine nucleotide-disulfide oxidoreductase, partial [Candidatus Thiodiazotropha sp.]